MYDNINIIFKEIKMSAIIMTAILSIVMYYVYKNVDEMCGYKLTNYIGQYKYLLILVMVLLFPFVSIALVGFVIYKIVKK